MYKVISETHIQKMPEGPTILRGDSGQWKQDQVLQEGRDFKRKKMHVDADGNPATVYTVGWIWVALPISKPQPIETLFKEAMEKEAKHYEDSHTDEIFKHGWQSCFNYLLTNKMIK